MDNPTAHSVPLVAAAGSAVIEPVLRIKPLLHSQATRLCREYGFEPGWADDVVQDVLVAVINRTTNHSADSVKLLDCYALRSLRNAFIDECRRRRLRDAARMKVATRQPTVAGVKGDPQEEEEINFILRHLPKEQQELLFCRFFKDMTVGEIATERKCSPKRIYEQVAVALSTLQKTLVTVDAGPKAYVARVPSTTALDIHTSRVVAPQASKVRPSTQLPHTSNETYGGFAAT